MPRGLKISSIGGKILRCYSTKENKSYNFYRLYEENHLKLPRVPIPDLNTTIERYLHGIKGLLNEKEFVEHEKLVRDFQKTAGPELHKRLVEQDAADARLGKYPYYFFEKCWDEGYLGMRERSPVNINPYIGFNKPAHKKIGTQAKMAGLFLSAFLKWCHKLRTGQMDAEKGADMSQFFTQLGTARIPKPVQDVLEFAPDSRHVVVIHEGKFFKAEVISADGKHVSAAGLENMLQSIINGYKDAPKVEVGLMTGEEREWWAKERKALEESPVNAASLKDIDSALIVIVLETAEPQTHNDVCRVGLLGTSNRWFDKHELIVNKNGVMGCFFEHSHSDGMTWIRWMGECWNSMHGQKTGYNPLPDVPTTENFPAPQVLKWDLKPATLEAIAYAKKGVEDAVANVDLFSLEHKTVNRETLKDWKVAPDGAVQVVYNLAHTKVHGYHPAVYESCSTRVFFHGRTETIRASTPEAKAFIEAFLNPKASDKEKWQKYQLAATNHGQRAKEAAQGQGVDRHMMSLGLMAGVCGITHPLFSDPKYKMGKTWRLSTSNLTVPYVSYFTFGPVIPNGYGIGYSILPDCLQINITSFKDNNTTDSKKLADAIVESFEQVGKLAKAK
jgi:hypothetical protein